MSPQAFLLSVRVAPHPIPDTEHAGLWHIFCRRRFLRSSCQCWLRSGLYVGFHDLELFRIKLAGLQQDVVRNAYLADVVKRSGFEKNINLILREGVGESGMRLKLLCQGSEIVLGALNMVSSFGIARLHH